MNDDELLMWEGERWVGHLARKALADRETTLTLRVERGDKTSETSDRLLNVYRCQGEIEALYRARFRAFLEGATGDAAVWLTAEELDASGLDRRVINPDDLPALRRYQPAA